MLNQGESDSEHSSKKILSGAVYLIGNRNHVCAVCKKQTIFLHFDDHLYMLTGS